MRRSLIVIALIAAALASCTDDVTKETSDAAVDAAVDGAAILVDADPQAPDAPPSACPESTDLPLRPPGQPPSGNWRGRWTCVSDCVMPPINDFPRTTELSINGSTLTWRGPSGIAIAATGTPDGNCWRIARDEDRCGTSFNVCPSSCAGISCVRVQFANWYNGDTQRWQTWEMAFQRP